MHIVKCPSLALQACCTPIATSSASGTLPLDQLPLICAEFPGNPVAGSWCLLVMMAQAESLPTYQPKLPRQGDTGWGGEFVHHGCERSATTDSSAEPPLAARSCGHGGAIAGIALEPRRPRGRSRQFPALLVVRLGKADAKDGELFIRTVRFRLRVPEVLTLTRHD